MSQSQEEEWEDEQSEAIPTPISSRMPLKKQIAIPLALVVGWGLYDLVFFRVTEPSNFSSDFLAGAIVVGPCFGQVVLLALWGAWGPGAALVRLIFVLAALVGQSIAVAEDGDLVGPLVPLGVAFATCAALLSGLRWLYGWSLRQTETIANPATSSRYGMKHLLLLTTMIAALAGVARISMVYLTVPRQLMNLTRFATTSMAIFLCTAPMILLFSVLLSANGGTRGRFVKVIMVTVVATATAVLLGSMSTSRDYLRELEQVSGVVVGAHAAVLVSALALRRAGYRVGRLSRGAKTR